MDELNLSLIEFRLRMGMPGSSPFVDSQEKLFHVLVEALIPVVKRRPWLKKQRDVHDWAKEVATNLFVKCLTGQTYQFTRGYLEVSLKGFLSGEKALIPPVTRLLTDEDARADWQDEDEMDYADLIQTAQQILDKFKAGLPNESETRSLFAAWVENGSSRGWKSVFARNHQVSNAWVTRRLESLRSDLVDLLKIKQFEIRDADQLIEFVNWFHSEIVPTEEQEEVASFDPGPRLEFGQQYQQLIKIFEQSPEIVALINDYCNGFREEQILARLINLSADTDQDTRRQVWRGRLRVIHQAYVEIAKEFRGEMKAERYYTRMGQGKANVEKACQAKPDRALEEIALARKLQELARSKVPFADLPTRLQLSKNDVNNLLLKIRQGK